MKKETTQDEDNDYIYRFKLGNNSIPLKSSPNNSTEDISDMVKIIIASLLDICCFTYQGRDVIIDGFRLNEGNDICNIR